jgi:hypothetical protein
VINFSVSGARPQSELNTAPFHCYTFDDGTVWAEFHRSGQRYLLRFPGLADFQVSADGTEVVAFPTAEINEATVEHLYINQLVPLALSRQGRPSFHASVVTIPGGAVAFLGKTGMGKSTLAASFAFNEAAFLADDALLVKETEGGCLALPSHASVRLWDDSVEALIDAGHPQAAQVSYSAKARLLAGAALTHSGKPQPLLAAYVLESEGTTTVAFRELAGADRQMGWVENSFLLDIEDRDLLARHFEWTHRISTAVPTFALDYPRNYGMLKTVRDAVRRHAISHEI